MRLRSARQVYNYDSFREPIYEELKRIVETDARYAVWRMTSRITKVHSVASELIDRFDGRTR